MTTPTSPEFPQLVQEYFCQHLVNDRNVSQETVASYRDTFRLLLGYLERHVKKPPVEIVLDHLNVPSIEAFLNYLESGRSNSIRTRNIRFAAIRSFLKYAASRDPTSLPTVQQVLAIPMKRFNRPQLSFLSRDEVQAILDTPDSTRWSGQRDRVMFATLYNTGARVSELIGIRVHDVSLNHAATALIHGKGRKERTVPLWKDTSRQIKRWLKQADLNSCQPLFPNASGGLLSRSGVEYRLKRAVAAAVPQCPSLKGRRVSPHTMRHTTAMHLLQSGVDITVIALWLGHENPATTHLYVEADLAMKERALRKLQEPRTRNCRYRPRDKLLQFLESL
jgi:site-specific recombinase XerD